MLDSSAARIPGLARPTTALGFGCNNLLGDKTREQGLALLSAAFDAGVRHFDVARYYGYGDAEGLVGDFATGRRDQITITSKFGLQPLRQITRLKGAVQLLRRLMRSSSFIRNMVRRKVNSMVQRGRFDVESARLSLETSLRELKTDFIDIYLLHECEPDDCRPDLLDFLERARQAGKIRAFGTGTAFSRTLVICDRHPLFTNVTEFESDFLATNVHLARQMPASAGGPARALITHGAFSRVLLLLDRMRADAAFAKKCNQLVGMNCQDPAALGGLILRHSMNANPGGIVLFRSTSPARIHANIRAAAELSMTDEQMKNLEQIGQELAAALQPAGPGNPPA